MGLIAATTRIGGAQLAEHTEAGVADAIAEAAGDWVVVLLERLVGVVTCLRADRWLDAL